MEEILQALAASGQKAQKYNSTDTRRQLCNRVSIEQHHCMVDEKTRIGDWEMDNITKAH